MGHVTVGDDDNNQERKTIAKKAWRTRCFYANAGRVRAVLLLCFVAMPFETLMAHLTYLDSRRGGFLDLVHGDNRNPFIKARNSIASIMRLGLHGPLGLVALSLPEREWQFLLTEARALGLELCSQMKWRFLDQECFPWQWAGYVHNAFDSVQQEAYSLLFP